MASGDVVNTAARLQSAGPSTRSWSTRRRIAQPCAAVEYDDMPVVEAKGKTEPIAVWQALAARSRFGVDVAHQAVPSSSAASASQRHRGRLRARSSPANAAAPHAGRRPRIGKSCLVYELQRIVGMLIGAHHLASGPLPRLWRRDHAVGARRDRQGAGWDRRTGLPHRKIEHSFMPLSPTSWKTTATSAGSTRNSGRPSVPRRARAW